MHVCEEVSNSQTVMPALSNKRRQSATKKKVCGSVGLLDLVVVVYIDSFYDLFYGHSF